MLLMVSRGKKLSTILKKLPSHLMSSAFRIRVARFFGITNQNGKKCIKIYQMAPKVSRWLLNIPDGHKDANIFNSKVLQNIPKSVFFGMQIYHLANLFSMLGKCDPALKTKIFGQIFILKATTLYRGGIRPHGPLL
jgi:hypothetical protein